MSTKTIVFITGTNGGIGYETVLVCAKTSPDFHILLGARDVAKGQKALKAIHVELAMTGRPVSSIEVVQIDITDIKSIEAAKNYIEQAHGKLDELINNLTEALEPLLKKSSKPYLIYISSGQGSITQRLDPNGPYVQLRGEPYRMSKAAIKMLSACHRFSFAEWGCKVLAFDPGFCVTNLSGEEGRKRRVKMGARTPEEPANTLVDIVLGKWDEAFTKSGLLDVDGNIVPW
ncbi:hypothetical protein Sste5346_008111 [Sporothrix stenoceras]|uniref:Uncharacterized protein n=1 Tax=Sporothrix stenoceras TaxID=5173 RepID=A0ABR3YS93_9PEZI